MQSSVNQSINQPTEPNLKLTVIELVVFDDLSCGENDIRAVHLSESEGKNVTVPYPQRKPDRMHALTA